MCGQALVRLKSKAAAAALAIGLLYFHILSRFEPHVETAFHFIVQRTWACWTCSAMRWRSSNRGVAVVTCCCMLLYTKCHSSQIRRSCQHDSGGPSHHAHGLCLHCLPNRQEMQITTACHLIQHVLIWLVLILGIPYGFIWYQYCNEENGHSHQYLDDRGFLSHKVSSAPCAPPHQSPGCARQMSAAWGQIIGRNGRNGCTGSQAGHQGTSENVPKHLGHLPGSWCSTTRRVKFHTVTQ